MAGRSKAVALLRASARSRGVRGPSARGEYHLCCPFCRARAGKDDEDFKLAANPKVMHPKLKKLMPLWNCYRCGAKGSGDLSWLGPGIEADPDAPRPGDWSEPPEGFTALDTHMPALAPYVDYLARRGVLDQALAVGAGACLQGKYQGRVLIPYMREGKWAGFSARAIRPNVEPKYRYPAGMDRRRAVWGADWVPRLKDKASPLWVVEGVFDALPLYPYGLCTFGKSVTPEQLDLLVGLGRPLVACLDGDAWEEAQGLAGALRLRGAEATWCRLPPTKDPGSLGWEVRKYLAPA